MKNIMTVDLEDWYNDINFEQWDHYEDRISSSTHKLLSILEKGNAKATFFVLGYIAERFPGLIKEIDRKGHEIATHGYIHQPILKQTPDEFEKALTYSVDILERIIHKKIIGFRAPVFSLTKKTQWAIPIITRYLRYDSSIVPAKTLLYGWPSSPRIPYNLIDDLLEFPIATYRIPLINTNFPVAGGFYLRLFPYELNRYCIQSINEDKAPAVCYIHPWELDPQQPRIGSNKWWHYYNLNQTQDIFAKLLTNFNFQSISDHLESHHLI